MSAYVVGKAHIDALITAGLTFGSRHGSTFRFYAGPDCKEHRLDHTNADTIGSMLLAENIKSVWTRYPESDRDDLPGPIPTPDPAAYVHRMHRLAAIAVLKALDGYEYQSCEHGEEWRQSPAKAYCDALRHAVIQALPGYDDAEWEVTEPQRVRA